MLRVFTEDVGAKFRKGDVRDYIPHVWKGIARSAGAPLDSFTVDPSVAGEAAVKDLLEEDNPKGKKRRGRPRKVRG